MPFVPLALLALALQSVPPAAPAPASPAPVAAPAAMASPAPTATPLPVPVALPPHAPPQIVALQISSTQWHAGDVVSGTVITSTNVASVQARVAGVSVNLARVDFGRFQLTYQIPAVPFFLHRGYTLHVIARNADGTAAERDLPVTLQ